MHPILLTIPGVALKLLCAGLWLWALSALGYQLYALARARLRPAAAVTPLPSDAASKPERSRDGASDALFCVFLAALGGAIFAYGAPRVGDGASILARLASSATWALPWRALSIYSYGAMLGLAIMAGWYLGFALVRRYKMPAAHYVEWSVCTAVTALLCARALYVVIHLSRFRDPHTHALVPGLLLSASTVGWVAYGGFFGGLLGSAVFFVRRGYRFWPLADVATPTLASGLFITRIGCYLAGCDFGRALAPEAPAALRAAGTFPRWASGAGSPAWLQHQRHGFALDPGACEALRDAVVQNGRCHLAPHAHASAPVHPTQLYESALGLVLFVVLLSVFRRKRFDGQVFLLFVMLYGVGRSALEVLRDDLERGRIGPLSTSQFIGLATAALAAGAYVLRARRGVPASDTIWREGWCPQPATQRE